MEFKDHFHDGADGAVVVMAVVVMAVVVMAVVVMAVAVEIYFVVVNTVFTMK